MLSLPHADVKHRLRRAHGAARTPLYDDIDHVYGLHDLAVTVYVAAEHSVVAQNRPDRAMS